MYSTDSKTFKLFNVLNQGQAVTPAQAAKRFGIKNIRAEATRIRQQGYPVYANQRKANNGVVVTEYSIGKPTRQLIAAGYRALAAGI